MNLSLFSYLTIALAMSPLHAVAGASQDSTATQFQPFEIRLESTHIYEHPTDHISLFAAFTGPRGAVNEIRGFWDGDRTWRIRFSPPDAGPWTFSTSCSDRLNPGLHGIKGSFEVGRAVSGLPFSRRGWPSVSDNGRHLIYTDGTPFFWLADTAWEMTWKSNTETMIRYLDDRKRKGFNVIQVVVLSHQIMRSFGVENRLGEKAFLDNDFARVNPRYYDYLDRIVLEANSRGLAVALVPLWAAMTRQHSDNETHQRLSDKDALGLASYIGARYAGDNVIWMIGGDNSYDSAPQREFWRNFAEAINIASGDMHLTTIHPKGLTASFDYFGEGADWLDFHAYQSSHLAGGTYTFRAAASGYRLKQPKPILNAEATYEDIFHNLWEPGDTKNVHTFRIRPEHVRQSSYESILSGALVGITYGANGVWQWATEEIGGTHLPRTTVKEAWSFPGSFQMTVLKDIMTGHRWFEITPRPEYVVAKTPGDRYIPLARNRDNIIVYIPQNTESVVLRTYDFVIRGDQSWIDPQSGLTLNVQAPNFGRGPVVLETPDSRDWVVILHRSKQVFSWDGTQIPASSTLHQNAP
ncbi:MAG: DUF4038 domain-containing protein, partial [Candidatus Latescibacteria bacterium]|nr:DUF4038 domain-containing protein [Candidatus Latescibacterota bacterium]